MNKQRTPVAPAVAVIVILLILAGCGASGKAKPVSSASGERGGTVAAVGSVSAVPARFTAVDFINQDTGWVAGYDDWNANGPQGVKLLRTTDGGRTWAAAAAPGGVVWGIYFRDALNGWLVAGMDGGRNLDVWASSDGGKTWRRQWRGHLPESMDNLTMQMRVRIVFWGAHDGYVLAGGLLLSTTDGGVTWKPVPFPEKFMPVDMSFVDFHRGRVAGQEEDGTNNGGSRPVVLATDNGGANWERSFSPPAGTRCLPYSVGLAFAGSGDGWLYFKDDGMNGKLYHTGDGGKQWRLIQTALASGRTAAGAPVFAGPGAGWLPVDAGAAPLPGGILITADGGRSWRWAGFDRGWSIRAVSLLSPDSGWAVGELPNVGDFLVQTRDGGKTWRQVLPSLRPAAGISFTGSGQGMGIGLPSDPGAVLCTADGGKTWRVVNSLKMRLLAVSCLDAREGWVVAGNPDDSGRVLLRTDDGGATWKALARFDLPPGTVAPDAPCLRFFNRREGLYQTAEWPSLTVSITADGGGTWKQQLLLRRQPGTEAKIDFSDPLQGFAALQHGLEDGYSLMNTSDGGRTWTVVDHLDRSYRVQCLSFITPQEGWMLVVRNPFTNHSRNEIMHTVDGGRTWREMSLASDPTGDTADFIQMMFINAGDGWLLTRNGLLRTTDGGRTWERE